MPLVAQLSHVNIGMPRGEEPIARAFYGHLVGLREIPKPESIRARGGLWFAVGTSELHISVEDERREPDRQRHFGLGIEDLEGLAGRFASAGVAMSPGRPVPWRRFFAHDPFGNRIEFHEVGAFRD